MCQGVRCAFPSSDEEGWPRHQKNIATASFDGADGVVSTRRNHFFANTTPSALARNHPASAEAGKARSVTLLAILDSCACKEGLAAPIYTTRRPIGVMYHSDSVQVSSTTLCTHTGSRLHAWSVVRSSWRKRCFSTWQQVVS